MHSDIQSYNQTPESVEERAICDLLAQEIETFFASGVRSEGEVTSKIWHAHPVWFINQNPIVGYSKQKAGIRLMFWSGASFEDEGLIIKGSKFKDASIFYNTSAEINLDDVKRWLSKSIVIQWDYKNIIKRKGVLERLH